MTNDALSRLVIDGYLLQTGDWAGHENYWAWTALHTLVEDRPDIAWPMLLEVIRRIPDEHLGELAAGPLEDFIAAHGTRVIDVLEAEAAGNARLRRALAGVWQNATPASVWVRVEALADRSGDLTPNVPDWEQRVIEAVIDSPPPLRAGSTNEADVEARSRLLELMLAAKRDDTSAWASPVGLEVHLEGGPGGFATDSTTVLRAIAEALASDRPPGVVEPKWAEMALIASTRQIRDVSVIERRSRAPGYRVRLMRMSEGQVKAYDDVSTFEEDLESTDIATIRTELRAGPDRLEPGDSTPPEPAG